jgi:outer membrane protein assembly factor BamB
MLRLRALAPILAVWLVAAARGEDFVAPAPLDHVGLVKFWQLQVPLDAGQSVRDVYQVDDALYVCTNNGYVFAIHADTGGVRWLRQVTRLGYRVTRPCFMPTVGEPNSPDFRPARVAFSTASELLVVNVATGDGVARKELAFPCGTPPVADKLGLYLGALNGRVVALDPVTLNETWRTAVDGPVSAELALADRTLYAATQNGALYSIDTPGRRFNWPEPAHARGYISGGLASDPNGVYVPCQDQSLYYFGRERGRTLWRSRLAAPLDEAPIIAGANAYQYDAADGLVAQDLYAPTEDQLAQWRLERGRYVLATEPERLFVLTRDQAIAVLNRLDGKVLSTISAPGFTLGVYCPQETRLYLADANGRLFCARTKGAPLPQAQDVMRGVIPIPPTAAPTPGTAAAPASTQPTPPTAEAPPVDPLASPDRGRPQGGKSTISRDWPESGGPPPPTTPPPTTPAPTSAPSDSSPSAEDSSPDGGGS